MHALVRAAVLFARFARELDGAADEEGAVGSGVDHLDEPRVEVDLRRERADRDERGGANAEDRRDAVQTFISISKQDDKTLHRRWGGSRRFIEEAFITVGCFF